MSRIILVIGGAIVVSCVYLWLSPKFVVDKYALIANFVAMPLVAGLIVGHMLAGRLPLKLGLLILVPIAHVLVFGSDPAKPGLENMVALIELIPLWLGCVVGHFLLHRKARPTTTENGHP